MRLEAERLAQIFEAEDSRRPGDRALLSFEPVSDLKEFPPMLAFRRFYISQVASNRVLKDGHQQLFLAFEGIAPSDQVGILRGHQDSRFD
jgi:hypothetical protein